MNKLSFALLAALCLLVGTAPYAYAQEPGPERTPAPVTGIELTPGTVPVPAEMAGALVGALAEAGGAVYAVTALQGGGEWAVVSVAGLGDLAAGDDWTLQDATWLGLVLLHRSEAGRWAGAVEGTAAFSELIAQVPDAVLSAPARRALDPQRRTLAPAGEYRFPWEPGRVMVYGGLGVHEAGFVDDWQAVDFLSDGDTAAGHAPNSLLAAAAGTISYVCDDGTSVAIRVSDLLYVHLALDEELVVGRNYEQGQEIGRLKAGPFRDRCGWTSQPANWFHLHWGFPDGESFQAGGWTLDLGDGLWRRGEETRGTGRWFAADGAPPDPGPKPDPDPTPDPEAAPCPAPALLQPGDGSVLAGPTVVFSWEPVSGCTFDGYNFRVCTTADLDDVEGCLVDAIGPATERRATLNGQDGQVLTWGVRTAGAPGGAEWAKRSFRIEPVEIALTYLPLILVTEPE